MQDRTAARRHGVDQHHRRAHPHPGDRGLEGALELAVVVRHVGRRAAHIEADHLAEPGHRRGLDHADHAAGRAGQDGVLALEEVRIGEAAVRLHEQQAGVAELGGDLVDIAAQDWREIGINHRGVAAADQLDQRAGLVAGGDLSETDPPGQFRHCLFVLRVAVAVHQDDRDRADAGVVGRLQVAAGRLGVGRH